jgi:hypothetical protein
MSRSVPLANDDFLLWGRHRRIAEMAIALSFGLAAAAEAPLVSGTPARLQETRWCGFGPRVRSAGRTLKMNQDWPARRSARPGELTRALDPRGAYFSNHRSAS